MSFTAAIRTIVTRRSGKPAYFAGGIDSTIRWERRERFPVDIFGQDGFENLLPELVRLDFALLSTLYGAGVLSHTNLLRAEV